MKETLPLTVLDFAVIALYFAVVLGVGLFMGRFVKSSGDFFSGGKRVPWWMGAVSGCMSMVSCFVFIAYAQIGYEDGLVGVTIFWSAAAAILGGTFMFARRWQRANLATPVEYLERRYGPGVRQVISWSGIVFRVLDNAVRLYTLGIITSQFLGVSLDVGIWLGALVVIVYTMTGGLWSVLVTDVIQSVVLMAVALTVLPLSVNAVGGLGALHAALPDHFSLVNGRRGTFLFLAAYYAVTFVMYNGSWTFVQRLASVPSERDAVKMGLLSAAIFFAFPIVAVLPAIAARVCLPDLPPEMHERCYIEMCSRLLPHGMLGMMVAAMFAASLSTLGGEFNVTSSVLTTDIYRRVFRKAAGEREILLVARLGTLGVAVLIAFAALFVAGVGGAFEANKLLMALFGVPIVVPSVFGILWKTPNVASVYLCLVAGVASGLCVKVLWPSLSWEAGTLVQIGVCFAGYFAGALFGTSKRERETKEILFRENMKGMTGPIVAALAVCAWTGTAEASTCADAESGRVKLEEVVARLERMPEGHPRLFVPRRDAFEEIRKAYARNPEKARLGGFIIARADGFASEPAPVRKMEGNRMRGQEEFQRRVWDFSGAYLLTGERKYVEAALKDVKAAARWEDWNPRHFLDTSKMLCGMAVVYDWLYAELSEADRELIRGAIVRLGLDPMNRPEFGAWRDSPSNWQQACWSGVCAAALAVWETDPKRCAELIHEAVNKLPISAAAYAPNGAYPEGPQYWGYGTTRFILILDMLENALGTDFGLRDLPGFLQSGAYMAHVSGPSGKTFNYSDNDDLRKFEPGLVWIYNRTGNVRLERAEWRRGGADRYPWFGNFPMLLFFWHDFDECGDMSAALPLDYSSHGQNPIVCSRSDWSERAAFVAAKGGRASYFHGHQDVGTFVFDLDGVRWVEELGSQPYYQVERTGMDFWDLGPGSKRWTVFRLSPRGHSLVTVGDNDLNVDGFAKIADEISTEKTFSVKIDLDAVYRGHGATSASRTVRLDRAARRATIEDRFGGVCPGTSITWAAITSATEIAVDGNSVRLGDGRGHTAHVVALQPAGAVWTVTDVSRGPHEWDAPNPGRRRLAFAVPASADGAFASVVTLGP